MIDTDKDGDVVLIDTVAMEHVLFDPSLVEKNSDAFKAYIVSETEVDVVYRLSCSTP